MLKKVVVVTPRFTFIPTVTRGLVKSTQRVRNIALLSLLALPALTHAYQVIGIADGDTLTLLVNQRPLKIRLANVDAPEKNQAYGQKSKQSLSALCWGKDAQYTVQNIDRYGRTVAVVRCGGIEVNRAQVERGMAWVYPQYNKDASLPALEQTARANKSGLWADARPLAPWAFRRAEKNRLADAAGSTTESTCYNGPRGGQFRLVDGKKIYGC